MSHFYKSILAVAAAAVSISTVNAQTVQVSKAGTITSVQEAIASFAGDLDPAPNVVQITDGEVYDEIITVNVPVTIEGTGANKPRLTVKANPNGRAGSAGLVVNLPASVTSDTVVLKNLAIIPSLAEANPISAAVNVFNNNAFVFLDDVVISGNDGADQPITTDGTINAGENAVHKHFADDLVVAGETDAAQVGDGVELLLRNTIISNNRGVGAQTHGVHLANNTETPGFRKLGILDGCVISYNGFGSASTLGYGVVATGDVEINAPNDRLILTGMTFGIFFNGSSPNERVVRGAVVASMGQTGIYESSTGGVRLTLEDSILVNNSRYNYWALGSADSPVNIRRSTIGNHISNSYQPLRVEPSTTPEFTIEDSIIMGNGSGNRTNVVWNQSTSTLTLVNSALVFSGNRSLFMEGFYLPQYVTKISVNHQNPHFENMTDPFAANFYAVTSPYYAELAQGNTPLAGGSVYTGTPIGPVTDEIITVSKSGSPNFSTIQAAIDSLSIDATKRYIIQILDNSVYDEVIDIKVPVTLQGDPAQRPVIAVQGNPAGYDRFGSAAVNELQGNGGVTVNLPASLTTGTVELKNLVIIPSMTGDAPLAGLSSVANNFYLNVDNVLVAGNNGSNAPISPDGLSQAADDPAFRYFAGFGGFIGQSSFDRPEGDGAEVRLVNSVFTHTGSLGVNATDPITVFKQGFAMPRVTQAPLMPAPVNGVARAGAYRHLTINDGCVFSYNVNGLRAWTNFRLYAPNQRVLFLGNQGDGVAVDSWHENHLDGFISVKNGKNGYADSSTTARRPNVRNSIIADNGWYNLYMYNGANSQSPNYFTNVTTANQSTSPTAQPNLMTIQVSGNSGGASTYMDVVLKDSVIAGHGDLSKTQNKINMGAQSGGTLTLDHTAVVTDGDHALTSPPFMMAAAVTIAGEPVTGADPQFLNTEDPTAPDYYAVSNAAYGTLSSTGGPLVGGGNYAPGSSVSDWSVY